MNIKITCAKLESIGILQNNKNVRAIKTLQ